jgi:hypothetical protein
MAEAEKAIHDIPISSKGDNIEFEMDDSIIDIPDQSVSLDNTKAISKKLANIGKESHQVKREKTSKGRTLGSRGMDKLAFSLPMADKAQIEKNRV